MPSTTGNPAGVSPSARVFMQGNDIAMMTAKQRALILSVRAIELDLASRTDTTPEQIRELVAGDVSPTLLFDDEVSQLGPIYRHLRDWLKDRNIAMDGQASRRIPYQLADTLYKDPPEADIARELSRVIVSGRKGGNTGGPGQAEGKAPAVLVAPPVNQRDRTGHDVGMRYGNASQKFFGGAEDALHEHVSGYLQICKDYNLNPEQQLRYLHNLFGGRAKRCYDLHVDGRVRSLAEALAKMNEEYNTPTRQTDVKHRVAGLRVSTFVAAGQTEKEALETVRTMIDQLSPQLAPLNRADENLVDYLRGAVVGEPWADSVVSRIATTKPSFQQLFLELDAALGLKEEGRAAVAKDVPINSQVAATKAALPVMYAGQGVYAYANRGVGATTPRSRATVGAPIPASRPSATRATTTTRPRFDPLSVAGCFNCDNPGHTMRQCPIPVDTFKAAQRKLAYYDKKHAGGRGGAATVLYLMCRQSGQVHPEEHDPHGVEDPAGGSLDGATHADAQLFETLLLTDGQALDVLTATGGEQGTDEMEASTSTQAGTAAGFPEGG